MSEEERTHRHRRADYQQVLDAIRANTGDPQPPLVRSRALWTTLVANGALTHEHAQSALRAARENGHVLRWVDGQGRGRYALTTDGLDAVDGTNPYTAADEDALVQCITTEANRDNPDQQVIGWANQRLAEVRG